MKRVVDKAAFDAYIKDNPGLRYTTIRTCEPPLTVFYREGDERDCLDKNVASISHDWLDKNGKVIYDQSVWEYRIASDITAKGESA